MNTHNLFDMGAICGKKLIVCQGPSQALSAIIALKRLYCEDYKNMLKDATIVIGGTYSVCSLYEIIKNIFSVWGEPYFIDASDIVSDDLDQVRTLLHERLHDTLGNFDSIFYARPGQIFNMALISLQKWKERVCFGDVWSFDFLGLPKHLRKDAQNDLCIGPLPFAAHARTTLDRYININFQEYREVISLTYSHMHDIEKLCKKYINSYNILTIENYTESKTVPTLQYECDIYCKLVLSTVPEGEHILIKNHPRAHQQKTALICNQLQSLGYTVSILEDFFNLYPVELLVPFLNVKAVLAGISGSSVILKMLYPDVKIVYGAPKDSLPLFSVQKREYILRRIFEVHTFLKDIQKNKITMRTDNDFSDITYEKLASLPKTVFTV